jgi:hypothetical protein
MLLHKAEEKMKICKWCGEKYDHTKYTSGKHWCPPLFIHSIKEHKPEGKEIIIRGDFEIEWIGNNLLIRGDYYKPLKPLRCEK